METKSFSETDFIWNFSQGLYWLRCCAIIQIIIWLRSTWARNTEDQIQGDLWCLHTLHTWANNFRLTVCNQSNCLTCLKLGKNLHFSHPQMFFCLGFGSCFYLSVGAGNAFRVVVDLCRAIDEQFLLIVQLAQQDILKQRTNSLQSSNWLHISNFPSPVNDDLWNSEKSDSLGRRIHTPWTFVSTQITSCWVGMGDLFALEHRLAVNVQIRTQLETLNTVSSCREEKCWENSTQSKGSC